MKNKIKAFGLCAAGLFCVALLAACGRAEAAPAPARPADSQEQSTAEPQEPKGELTVYLEATYANPLVEYPIYQKLLQFQKEYPGVSLRFVSPSGGLSDYEAREAEITQINTEILSGGGPDVFLMGVRLTSCNLFPDLQKAMRNGAFLECGSLLKAYGADCESTDYWPGLMQAGRWQNGQYIVPLSFDVLTALADGTTLAKSGFSKEAAGKSTEAFIAQCRQAYLKSGLTTNLEDDLSAYMAQPLLDYENAAVHLGDEAVQNMLELNRQVQTNTTWMQGLSDFVQESQNPAKSSFAWCEANRLYTEKRLFEIGSYSNITPSARALTALSGSAGLLAVPNEQGGVTAMVRSYGMINANTQNASAAAALLAYLLSGQAQEAGAWPDTLQEIPVRKSALAPSAAAYYERQKNIWWLTPSAEQIEQFEQQTQNTFVSKTKKEKQDYQEALGNPLDEKSLQSLANACGRINAVQMQSLWYDSVGAGQGAAGDQSIAKTYQSYINGEITLAELTAQLTPRLELYLDE